VMHSFGRWTGQWISRLTVTMVLLFATSRVAAAAPVIFTDETAYNAALAAAGLTTATESFEDIDAGIYGELDFGAFTLETTFFNFITDEVATDGVNGLVELNVAFIPTFAFHSPVRAFSLDVLGALDRNGGQFSVDLDGREELLLSGTLPPDNLQFLGFIDLVTPFTRVTLYSSDFVDDFVIDRVRYEDVNATPVPEPASLMLLAAGLLGTAARLRGRGSRRQPRG
jgi:PEP-CTERM motif